MTSLIAGLEATAEWRITERDLVPAFANRFSTWTDVPAVAASIIVIGLMEEACVRAVSDHLDPRHATLGTEIDFTHLAPSPVGALLRASAVLARVDGRRLTFDVTCRDDRERIGEMRHVRAIVDREAFEHRLRSKTADL